LQILFEYSMRDGSKLRSYSRGWSYLLKIQPVDVQWNFARWQQ